MSLTFSQTQGNGSTLSYPIVAAGGYFEDTDIVVELITIADGTITEQVKDTDYTIEDNNVIFAVAPTSDYYVRIRRYTDRESTYSDFTRGNSFGADNLNNSFRHSLYQTQQLADGFLPDDHYFKADVNAGGRKITNLANGVNPQDAATVAQLGSVGIDPGSPATSTAIASLTNDSALVTTYSDGSGGTYGTEAVTTTMEIYSGGELQTGWTFSKVDGPGLTSTIDPVTGTCVVTNLTDETDSSYVTITATKDGYFNRQAVFVIAKAKKGVDGASLTNYWLTSSIGAIKKDKEGNYTPSYITFYSWLKIGDSDSLPYIGGIRIFLNGSDIPSYSGRVSSVNFTITGSVDTVVCKLYQDDSFTNLLDIEGVPVISDGADGADGVDGVDGVDGLGAVDISNWSSELILSSTDYNTVSWESGFIYTYANGAPITYQITAANTGDMLANTTYYIYLDPSISTSLLQVTTDPSKPVGLQQILVAVAFPNTDITSDAQFQVFGGKGGVFIGADSIAASCITGDKIASNTLTSAHIQTDGLVSYGELSGTKPPIDADSTQTQLDLGADIQHATVYGSSLLVGGYFRTDFIQVGEIAIGDLQGASSFTANDTNYVAGTSAAVVKNNAASGATFTSSSLLDYTKVTGTKPPANADKTSLNTALDTTRVNGLASSTLISGGYIGTGLVVANSLAAGSITASKMDTGALSTCKFYCHSSSNPTAYSTYLNYTYSSSTATALAGVNASSGGTGIYGNSTSSSGAYGVWGKSAGIGGVLGTGTSPTGYGVQGSATNGGKGVIGSSPEQAVVGETSHSSGFWGLLTYQKAYIGGATYPFTGTHLGFMTGNAEIGDILCAAGAVLNGISDANPICVLSSKKMDKTVIGVCAGWEDTTDITQSSALPHVKENEELFDKEPINEKITIVEEDDEGNNRKKGDKIVTNDGYTYKLKTHLKATKTTSPDTLEDIVVSGEYHIVESNAIGEGGINVCSEGGDIEIGDYICSSSTPGKGMKQQDDILHNYTVAKSLVNVTWDKESKDQIKMIACTYHCG